MEKIKNFWKKGILNKIVVIVVVFIGIGIVGSIISPAEDDLSSKNGDNTNTSDNGNNSNDDKKEFEQNEIVTYEDVEYSITNVERTTGKQYTDSAAEGKEFVIITLKIENKSDKKISYASYDWKMVNSKGQEDDQAITIVDSDTSLSTGDLLANGVIEGTVVFEQEKGETNLKLNYYDNMFNDDYTFQFNIK